MTAPRAVELSTIIWLAVGGGTEAPGAVNAGSRGGVCVCRVRVGVGAGNASRGPTAEPSGALRCFWSLIARVARENSPRGPSGMIRVGWVRSCDFHVF